MFTAASILSNIMPSLALAVFGYPTCSDFLVEVMVSLENIHSAKRCQGVL
jgi:hypothetical protein